MLGKEVYTPLTLLAPPTPGQANDNNQWVEGLHERFRISSGSDLGKP